MKSVECLKNKEYHILYEKGQDTEMVSFRKCLSNILNKLQTLWLTVDAGLLSLLLIAVLINLPSLLGYILPAHDTMYMFQVFYYFYNDFFISGDIPRWLPFGFYGVQSDNILIAILSPSTYFVGLIGYIAGVKNILLLFNLSILLEEIIFLFGTYLLAGYLFRHKGIAFIVSLTALCGSVLTVQFLLNFHIYSSLPFIIYLLIRAFRTYSYKFFFLAMIVFIISLFGNPPYFTPIPLLAVLIVFIALFLSHVKNLLPFLRPSKGDVLASTFFFSIFLIVTLLYYHFISNAMNHAEGIYIGRDPVTLKTDLSTFLYYANNNSFEKFKGLVLPYEFIYSDLSIHVGFITLLFALFSIFFVRRALSLAFVSVIIVFSLLSLGSNTPVAKFLYYYFPMMDYYRHINNVVSNYKLFIPLLAGFGLEHFLEQTKNNSNGKGRLIFVVETLTAIAVLIGSIVYTIGLFPEKTIFAVIVTMVFLIILFSLRYRFGVLPHTEHFLIACFLFQMLSYQALVNATMHQPAKMITPVKTEVISVHNYEYQNVRTQSPYGKRTLDAISFVNITRVNYTFAYNFLFWDPCISIKRLDFLNKNVYEYFTLKQAEFVNINPRVDEWGKRLMIPMDSNFLKKIGCNSSKLKLFKKVIFSDSIEESKVLLKNTSKIGEALVLNGVEEKERSKWVPTDFSTDNFVKGTIHLKNFSANRLSLDVDVEEERGAWLYYADAFHPGWKAYVNGNNVSVAQANIAFKAIFLGQGRNSVELIFENEPFCTIGQLLILFGIIFTTIVLFIMFKMCFSKHNTY